MKKFGKSAPEMLSDGLAQSVLVSRSEANGMIVDEWTGIASSKFALESMIWKSPKEFVDVDTAELSNLIGCVSNKIQEVSAEVGMNLGGMDLGKVVGTRGNSSQGGDGASTNTSKDMVKVFAARRL